MASQQRWSRTVGTRRGNRIRVYEREPGGKLYAAVGDPERLKSMMTWATMVYENGRPLLDRNPLTGFVVPKEPNPNRPVVDGETVEKLLAVADRVGPLLPLLIKLMDWTGRRLGSVLNIRWDDFDFEKKTIRWRAEHDKKRKTWVVPMPKEAERALLEFRSNHRL